MGEPNPRVVILGGGQLARMLCAAATRLGVRTVIVQEEDSGASAFARHVTTASWRDEAALRELLEPGDVVTLDQEAVDLSVIRNILPEGARLWPSADTMDLVSDKARQKQHAERCGLPVGRYAVCSGHDELDAAAERLGFPLVLKRPTHSYDGYGNRTARSHAELYEGYAELKAEQVLVEAWVPFRMELAVMVARRPGGETVSYPVAATHQREHRCEAVEVPAPVSPTIAARAIEIAERAADAYGCVGVVGVELFLLEDGKILVNEIAPRPHNTGHYTLEACLTSQFENHLRGVLDLPLGDTALLGPAAAMVNVLGERHGQASVQGLRRALAVEGAAVHVYDKREVRPGRKMGHVTALGSTVGQARIRADEAARRLAL